MPRRRTQRTSLGNRSPVQTSASPDSHLQPCRVGTAHRSCFAPGNRSGGQCPPYGLKTDRYGPIAVSTNPQMATRPISKRDAVRHASSIFSALLCANADWAGERPNGRRPRPPLTGGRIAGSTFSLYSLRGAPLSSERNVTPVLLESAGWNASRSGGRIGPSVRAGVYDTSGFSCTSGLFGVEYKGISIVCLVGCRGLCLTLTRFLPVPLWETGSTRNLYATC